MRGTPLLTVSVASMSDPKATAYTVTLFKDTAPWCTCAAQRFAVAKRPCKHIRSVLAASRPGGPTSEFTNVLGPSITVSAAILGTAEDESFEFRGVHRA